MAIVEFNEVAWVIFLPFILHLVSNVKVIKVVVIASPRTVLTRWISGPLRVRLVLGKWFISCHLIWSEGSVVSCVCVFFRIARSLLWVARSRLLAATIESWSEFSFVAHFAKWRQVLQEMIAQYLLVSHFDASCDKLWFVKFLKTVGCEVHSVCRWDGVGLLLHLFW